VPPLVQRIPEVDRAYVQQFRPILAILQRALGLDLVAGGDEDIQFGSGPAGQDDGMIVIGVGDADLARFLDNLQGGWIFNPCSLAFREVFEVEAHFGWLEFFCDKW